MPRTRRWSQVAHGFSAGILSPAAQDQVDSQAWLAGAARLDNFSVERDGGISGRPAFARSTITIPKPRYGLLANAAFGVNPGANANGARASSNHSVPTNRLPADLYNTPGGIADVDLTTTSVAADLATDLMVVRPNGGAARAITFHGMRITQGEWSGVDAGQIRPNLRVVGRIRGGAEMEIQPTFAPDEDADPFDNGVLAPGSVKRDVVVRLDVRQETTEVDWESIAIRFARTGAASPSTPFQMRIDGLSMFSEAPAPAGAPASTALPDDVFDAPYRIIPWIIRDVPMALVLGMNWVSLVQVGEDTVERRQGDDETTRYVWHFTERQLREMTSAVYGGNLLLCHQDFPHPLEVRLPQAGEGQSPVLNVRPLRITNMPQLSAEGIARIAPSIERDTGAISFIAPGETRIPQRPEAPALASVASQTLRVSWLSTGADVYRIYYDLRAVYDATVTGGVAWIPGNQVDVPEVPGRGVYQHNLTGLVNGTEYVVAIASRVGTSESARGPVAFAIPFIPLTVPGSFAAVAATTGTTDGAIDLSWSASSGATNYLIQWYQDSPGSAQTSFSASQQITAAATATSHRFLGSAGSSYRFRIRAVSSGPPARESAWTAEVRAAAVNRTPAVPRSLTGFPPDSIQGGWGFRWFQDNPPADSMQIQYQPTSASPKWDPGTTVNSAVVMYNTLSQEDDGRFVLVDVGLSVTQAGVEQRSRIKAIRANAADSGWSNEIEYTPLRNLSGTLRLLAPTFPSVTLSTVNVRFSFPVWAEAGARMFIWARQSNLLDRAFPGGTPNYRIALSTTGDTIWNTSFRYDNTNLRYQHYWFQVVLPQLSGQSAARRSNVWPSPITIP